MIGILNYAFSSFLLEGAWIAIQITVVAMIAGLFLGLSAGADAAGILAVNRNQSIAAASLGMGPVLTLRRIILPQAMRAILSQSPMRRSRC